MRTAKKLYIGAFARTSYGLIQMAVAFFMMPFILGKLGDDWYGIWVLVGSIGGYYYLLDMGLSSAVSRYVAHHLAKEEHEGANTVINTSLAIYSGMALVVLAFVGAVALGAGYFVEDPSRLGIVRAVLLITGLKMTIEFPFKAFVGIVQARVRYDLLTVSHLITLAISTAATVFFLSRGFGILALAWIAFATHILAYIMFVLIARYLFREMALGISFFRRERVRELFGYSIWSFLIQIANQLRFKIDSVVLAALLSTAHVTHYFIGARLVEYFMDLLYRATNMLAPVFTSYNARNDLVEMRKKLLLMNRIGLVLALFGGGLILVMGDAFIRLWMGEEYRDAYPVLVVLTVAMCVNFIMNPSVNVLYAMARHRYLAWVNIAEGVANLGLSILLIRKFGMIGCAYGTAIPLLVSRLILIPVYVCRSVELTARSFFADMAPTALFTLAYIGAFAKVVQVVGLPDGYGALALAAVAACPLYLVGVLFISFSREERRLLLSFLPERKPAAASAK